ncbi:hypothetical protein A2W45_00590 [Candidatus Curtissbacteria bacterium RIFCSPHIGHO2_12_41_11]|uniref:Four helix bundle protein n=3 Tax=Candidatus Curtissiibacteriota TaxID=1752717 RepID=A0A1F5HT52_9BACT|nr:MAG: hypothetical protein A2W45_00590 [Candidatus Curtissbacteria bacterium RIFCSPHIGHO2_12_41_11]OGE07175.1 MAG: hypothetical protein A2W70_01925 [Candidatus Curtissbacteria bacterium RIFCSPLOWO2_02_41_11]
MEPDTVNFRFLNFKVYKDAKKFYHEIVRITANFPRQYWELGDQMRRSALSVILNLAEGSAKKSDRDFNRYIKNSLGSINECAAGIDVAFGEKLVNEEVFKNLMIKASEIANQLGGFSKSLR